MSLLYRYINNNLKNNSNAPISWSNEELHSLHTLQIVDQINLQKTPTLKPTQQNKKLSTVSISEESEQLIQAKNKLKPIINIHENQKTNS